MKNVTYVFGHKNPDTDSIVSATAFAELKNLLGETEYRAARAGKLNPQTDYIYKKFGVASPEYIADLIPKAAFYMNEEHEFVHEGTSLWNAAKMMQKSMVQFLPVVDDEGKYKSMLYYDVFAKKVLSVLNPEHHLSVSTSIDLIVRTLKAQPLNVSNEGKIVKATIIIGAANFDSFMKTYTAHRSEKVIVITGDREDIQKACIENNVFALVLSGGKIPSKELLETAKKNGTSIIVSSFDTASTTMLISYSTPVSEMSDSKVTPVSVKDTILKIRSQLHESPSHALPVVDENNLLIGVITENDLLHESKISVSLVDHNELSQAVEGIENYRIREVIDHHRIGAIPTKYPITFINRPVGSTSTQIAEMFREKKIPIPLQTAQLLLCGILSDTLILKSATTTESDIETADYLSTITGLDVQQLGEEIIRAGSKIGDRSSFEVIKQDMKEYNESSYLFTVSQIEVGNTDEVINRKKDFLDDLEIIRRSHGALFSSLLVTDISSLSSMMLVAGAKDFLSILSFPKQDENIYFLKDVVSRKKQLVPILSEILSNYGG